METRVAVMSIIVENPEMVETLNAILHEYGEYIIGLICCLYVEGAVNITFSNTCTSIRRDPANDEEYQQWLDEHFK